MSFQENGLIQNIDMFILTTYTTKDYHGITVESLRSPSGSDSWHHRKGYGVGGIKAVEGFIHSKDHGQVARLTHIF